MNFKTTSTQIGQCLENKFYKGLKSVNTSCSTPVSVSGSGCYNPGKANVVTDALSRKSLFALRAINTQLSVANDGSVLAKLRARLMSLQEICEA